MTEQNPTPKVATGTHQRSAGAAGNVTETAGISNKQIEAASVAMTATSEGRLNKVSFKLSETRKAAARKERFSKTRQSDPFAATPAGEKDLQTAESANPDVEGQEKAGCITYGTGANVDEKSQVAKRLGKSLNPRKIRIQRSARRKRNPRRSWNPGEASKAKEHKRSK